MDGTLHCEWHCTWSNGTLHCEWHCTWSDGTLHCEWHCTWSDGTLHCVWHCTWSDGTLHCEWHCTWSNETLHCEWHCTWSDGTLHCQWHCTCSESQSTDLFPYKPLTIHYLQPNSSFTLTHNYVYSLYSSGYGEVPAVACTEHGTDSSIQYSYSTATVQLQYNANCCTVFIYLFPQLFLPSGFGHLCAVGWSVAVCSLYVNVFGNSLQIRWLWLWLGNSI
jgi:hypothetical protein